ncbi:hypothetical protein CCACVL1_02912 [Corchorus capsularis]|uniref:Uncharacterized protein n=2 Tax=Corchorus TaxID=93758 RepID=A0A1R3K595_COCAP|nr:hypothetical protein COLO4_25230 [Corchorus olitorius]OMP02148.1 hypothetical protein CCACVL1_02912 [Corchorus capsularis]
MDTSKGSAHQPQSFTVKQKDSTISLFIEQEEIRQAERM